MVDWTVDWTVENGIQGVDSIGGAVSEFRSDHVADLVTWVGCHVESWNGSGTGRVRGAQEHPGGAPFNTVIIINDSLKSKNRYQVTSQ